MYEAVSRAVERARKGEGPTLIECKTYRWQGHHVGDPGEYRAPEELAVWKAREPLVVLQEKGLLSDGEIEEIRASVETVSYTHLQELAVICALETYGPDPAGQVQSTLAQQKGVTTPGYGTHLNGRSRLSSTT